MICALACHVITASRASLPKRCARLPSRGRARACAAASWRLRRQSPARALRARRRPHATSAPPPACWCPRRVRVAGAGLRAPLLARGLTPAVCALRSTRAARCRGHHADRRRRRAARGDGLVARQEHAGSAARAAARPAAPLSLACPSLTAAVSQAPHRRRRALRLRARAGGALVGQRRRAAPRAGADGHGAWRRRRRGGPRRSVACFETGALRRRADPRACACAARSRVARCRTRWRAACCACRACRPRWQRRCCIGCLSPRRTPAATCQRRCWRSSAGWTTCRTPRR